MSLNKIFRNTLLVFFASILLSACAVKTTGKMQGDVYTGKDTVEYLASGVPDRVFFATNETVLTTASRETLRKQASWLRKNSKINFKEEDIREFLYQDREIDLIEENEAKKQIERINNELDEQQKIMIKMNFFENKSHKKIADELEIPLGTVKSRIRHILTKMQEFLRWTKWSKKTNRKNK